MANQLDIFDVCPPIAEARALEAKRDKPAAVEKPSIDERFAEFHAANPHVLVEMLRLARERLARDERRISIKALWEELRSWLKVTGQGDYKLNNDYTAGYARKLIEFEPALAGVIEMRKRKGEP